MRLGVIMLAHSDLHRAQQIAEHWTRNGCPVVLHIDTIVDEERYSKLTSHFDKNPLIRFAPRYRCEWGMWGIVAASQSAAETMLKHFPDVGHVLLSSGSCLPIRPVHELISHLEDHPDTDFIESSSTSDVPWTVGGLDRERFTLYFPFSWRKNKSRFDFLVELQRKLKIKRKLPAGLNAHMGSQWWCLTHKTLSAILTDRDRKTHDQFFKSVWIPDESYFQTLTRKHALKIESRSLTLSKFDFRGRPHIFYDDHEALLRSSDRFIARKIWVEADGLYGAFLQDDFETKPRSEIDAHQIDRFFQNALERRIRGRRGLEMQSRIARRDADKTETATDYTICQGFDVIISDYSQWLSKMTDMTVHGALFAKERVHFTQNLETAPGALCDSAALRDYDPASFLKNFIWSARQTQQCFQYRPADNQDIHWLLAKDPNAHISIISGAWTLDLLNMDLPFSEKRRLAALWQKQEQSFIDTLHSPWAKADFKIWSLADFVRDPKETLQDVLHRTGQLHSQIEPVDMPKIKDISKLSVFLDELRDSGLRVYLAGNISSLQPTKLLQEPQPESLLL